MYDVKNAGGNDVLYAVCPVFNTDCLTSLTNGFQAWHSHLVKYRQVNC
jgi:hypothetical protein